MSLSSTVAAIPLSPVLSRGDGIPRRPIGSGLDHGRPSTRSQLRFWIQVCLVLPTALVLGIQPALAEQPNVDPAVVDPAVVDPAAVDPAAVDPAAVDPAAWGADHVGQPFPEYLTGDECLFCHRKVGATWNSNPHQQTIREATAGDLAIGLLAGRDSQAAGETQYLLGARQMTRFLRRGQEYGKLEMLSAKYLIGKPQQPETADLVSSDSIHWDVNAFADRCAGCHTTAVDTKSRSFSTVSLDCVACHGEVELAHTSDVSKVLLSSKNREPQQVISICAQCHLRGGKSKSSGLPYPNTFVAGDNLFRDFQVDLSSPAIRKLPVVQQHIYLNARDVATLGLVELTCVSCHEVHGDSSDKHQQLDDSAICASCHLPNTDNTELSETFQLQRKLRTNNLTCDY